MVNREKPIPDPQDPGYAEYVQEQKRKAVGGAGPPGEPKRDQLSADELSRYKELMGTKESYMQDPTEYRRAKEIGLSGPQKPEAKPGTTLDDELLKTKQSYMEDPTEYRRAKEMGLAGPQKGEAQTEEPRQLEGPPEPALLEDLRDKPLVLEGKTQPDTLPGPEEKKALPPHPEQRALPPHEEARKAKIVFADIKDVVEQEAWNIAESRLERERKELKGVGGFLKRFWKHNFALPYYRRREYHKVKQEMEKAGELYVGDKASSDEAKQAILDRFASDYAQEMISKDEDREVYTDLNDAVRGAINDFARSGDDRAFQESCDKVLEQLAQKRGVPVAEMKDALNHVNNLYKTAESIRQNYQELEKLGRAGDALLADVEVIWGTAKSSVKTDAQFNKIDQWIDKLERKTRHGAKLTSAVNEFTVGAAAAIGYSIATRLFQGLSNNRVAKICTFGGTAVIASGVAAAKENHRLIAERAKHSRDIARGKKFDPKEQPRRAEMEKYTYEVREAKSLMAPLEQLYKSYDLNGKRELRDDLTGAEIQAALDALAQIEARTQLNDEHRIDLISYSDNKKVEQERFQLSLLRAQAKVDLRNQLFDAHKATLATPAETNFDQFLEKGRETGVDHLLHDKEKGVLDQDHRFKVMKAQKVGMRALKTLGVGLFVGGVAQEVRAAFSDSELGVAEAVFHRGRGAEKLTPLAKLFSRESVAVPPGMSKMLNIGGQEIPVTLPQGADLIDPDGDGVYTLMREGKQLCDVEFNPDGSFTQATQDAFKGLGIASNSEMLNIDTPVPGGKDPESIRRYVDENPGLFKKIKRILWYDNGTEAPKFDKNEIKLWWGGEGGTGVDAEGNFVFDIRQMQPGGSYHGDLSIDAQEAMKAGKLKMLLSLDRGSQTSVVEVPIGPDGKALIPRDSNIAKMLFRQGGGGKAEFLGKYAEVAEMTGKQAEDGREMIRILATHVGKGEIEVPGAGLTEIPKHTLGMMDKMGGPVEWPPFVPILGRYPLEPERKGQAPAEGPQGPEHIPRTGTTAEGSVESPTVVPIGERKPLEPGRKKEEQTAEVEQGKKMTPEQVRIREEFVQNTLQPTFNRWERENGVKVTSVDLEETTPGEGKLTINIDPKDMPYDNRVQLIAAGAQEIKTDDGSRILAWEIPIPKRADGKGTDVNEVIHYIEGVGEGFVVAAAVAREKDKGVTGEDNTKTEVGKKRERPKKDQTKRPARIRPEVKVNAGEAAETPAEPELTPQEWGEVDKNVDYDFKVPDRYRLIINEKNNPTEKEILESLIYLHSPRASEVIRDARRDYEPNEKAAAEIRLANKVLNGGALSPEEKTTMFAYAQRRKGTLEAMPTTLNGNHAYKFEKRILERMEDLYGEGKAEEPELDKAA